MTATTQPDLAVSIFFLFLDSPEGEEEESKSGARVKVTVPLKVLEFDFEGAEGGGAGLGEAEAATHFSSEPYFFHQSSLFTSSDSWSETLFFHFKQKSYFGAKKKKGLVTRRFNQNRTESPVPSLNRPSLAEFAESTAYPIWCETRTGQATESRSNRSDRPIRAEF